MTKAEMIAAMARGAGISKKEATKALDSYINAVKAELRRTGTHSLTGFGTFSVVKRKARTGRNPQTGAKIQIREKRAVKFRAGKGLREIIEEFGGGPVPPPRKK